MPTKVKGTNLDLTNSNVTVKEINTTDTLTVGNTSVQDLKEIEEAAALKAVAYSIALG
jgi:hypothetical protein